MNRFDLKTHNGTHCVHDNQTGKLAPFGDDAYAAILVDVQVKALNCGQDNPEKIMWCDLNGLEELQATKPAGGWKHSKRCVVKIVRAYCFFLFTKVVLVILGVVFFWLVDWRAGIGAGLLVISRSIDEDAINGFKSGLHFANNAIKELEKK